MHGPWCRDDGKDVIKQDGSPWLPPGKTCQQGAMLRCMPPFFAALPSLVVLPKKRINAHVGAASSGYECGAICRDAAVTVASLQTLQLRQEVS